VWYEPGRLAEQFLDTPDETSGDSFARALGSGDTQALRLAYRQHHEVVRAFARRLLGSESDAEELVQETFLAIPAAMRRFRGECTLRTYFLAIAASRSRNMLRARKRRWQAEERLRDEPAPSSRRGRAPDEVLMRQRLAERLQRALDALPDDQRIAFVLAEVEERSSLELSQILGVPASTLRARVAAAKDKLRALLTASEREETP
jgi:RNA polymerase sigma-70 factor (ECF subfamily)